jgi:uncharacterized protein (TIGR00290 family)
MKKKAIFCWSGGKDSSLALYKVLKEDEFEILALLTTVNEEFKRVSMHGVREDLLEEQAKQIGLPLEKMYIGKSSTNEAYEKSMEAVLLKYKALGVEYAIFGDIFLEDLKKYREDNLSKIGMKAYFPLWKQDTTALIHEFVGLGFKTMICCTNNDFFDENGVGRIIDEEFISTLPDNVDPCGENGEFHTFAYEGPIFKNPIPITVGEKVLKTYQAKCMKDEKEVMEEKGFWFVDLVLSPKS